MRLYYLSDLHLRDEKEKNSKRLISFLQTIPSEGDVLVLGGDIFDLFIDNKIIFQNKFAEILNAIRQLAKKGCTVYYLEGNHDFHMNEVFSIQSGILVKTDDFFLDFSGKKIWVSHGDLIDAEDRGYRLLRATTRHPLVRSLIKAVPGGLIDRIGNWSSKKSRKYNNPTAAGELRLKRVKTLFEEYALEKAEQGFQYILIGHSHIAEDTKFKIHGKNAQYLNLGFSKSELLYAELGDDDHLMKAKAYSLSGDF